MTAVVAAQWAPASVSIPRWPGGNLPGLWSAPACR